MLIINEKRYKK